MQGARPSGLAYAADVDSVIGACVRCLCETLTAGELSNTVMTPCGVVVGREGAELGMDNSALAAKRLRSSAESARKACGIFSGIVGLSAFSFCLLVHVVTEGIT